MMRDLLDDRRVEEFCAARPRWEVRGRAIVGEARAGSFVEAIGWVDRVAEAAEELDHHPDIDIRWCTLTFGMSTHSAGGLTELDLLLAERIDAIVDGVLADAAGPATD